MTELLKDIEEYWTSRAKGYSQVNQEELSGDNRVKWLRELKTHIPNNNKKDIKVLDIGTGPGFFAILMAKEGYDVTAIDYTESMMEEARKNAGTYADNICFLKMDAQNLTFPDTSFDVIITRNLTWNLELPRRAYEEWFRVLKTGGMLLNFDANWYQHLFDEEKREAYEADRMRVMEKEIEDHYTCTDIDAMEDIARRVPLSLTQRPAWDEEVLREIGFKRVETDGNVWERVWSEVEKINYGSTPMFLVKAIKE